MLRHPFSRSPAVTSQLFCPDGFVLITCTTQVAASGREGRCPCELTRPPTS